MAAAAQLKSRTQTPAPTTAESMVSAQPPLPQAGTFDILPPLHALLSQLEPSLNTYTPDPEQASTTATADGSSGQSQQLSYKDAAVAAGFLKSRIRKILAELGGLEDMDRTVEQQEAEVRELEGRIERQREVLVRLGTLAGEMEKGVR